MKQESIINNNPLIKYFVVILCVMCILLVYCYTIPVWKIAIIIAVLSTIVSIITYILGKILRQPTLIKNHRYPIMSRQAHLVSYLRLGVLTICAVGLTLLILKAINDNRNPHVHPHQYTSTMNSTEIYTSSTTSSGLEVENLGPNSNLSGRIVKDLTFTDLNLNQSNLSYALASNTQFVRTSLHGASFESSILDNANLSSADLSYANLSMAFLSRADMENVNLQEGNLTNAILSSTNLTNANLQNANLNNAFLANADLTNADLSGANLLGANLEGVKGLDTALFTTQTILPTGEYWTCTSSLDQFTNTFTTD